MKTSCLLLSVFAALGAAASVHAQAVQPASKTPADVAAESFFKLADDRGAKPDEARFDKLIGTGIAFLATTPEHDRAPEVVSTLAMFGGTMGDPKLAAHRASYAGKLSTAIIDFRYKTGLAPAAKAACAALDAGLRDYEARRDLNRESLRALREKIDELASQPESGRFLVDREASYVELAARSMGAGAAQKHLTKLLAHSDAGVARMARDNLNLAEVRKGPYELKFTALDGKECDVGKLRGKLVAILFWSTKDEASIKQLATLKTVHSKYRANGFEVVGVSLDQSEDREKVLALVAEKKLAWPIHHDGKGQDTEWITKLNVRKVPTLVLFDTKGMLLTSSGRVESLDSDLKSLFAATSPAPATEMPAAGGKRR